MHFVGVREIGRETAGSSTSQDRPHLRMIRAPLGMAILGGLARSTGITSQSKPQRGADFGHSRGPQLGNPSSQALLRNRDRIVQVYGAMRFHAILDGQNYF